MLTQTPVPKEVCAGCGSPIEDKFLLKVSGNSWHESCLQCHFCGLSLKDSCYSREGRLYCRRDYEKTYRTKCTGCHQMLLPSDVVMRASSCVYHEACFRCAACGQRLQSGHEYVLCGTHLICRQDFERQLRWFHFSQSDGSDCCCGDDLGELDLFAGSKRPRTILTTGQRRKFKAAFEVNPKPSRKVREALATETGLCVRVVQVWFQNQRAKVKQIARKLKDDPSDNKDKKDSAKNTCRPQKTKVAQDVNYLCDQQISGDRSTSADTNSYSSSGAESYFPDGLTTSSLNSCQGNLYTPIDENSPMFPTTPVDFEERMDQPDHALFSWIKGQHLSEVMPEMNSSFYQTETFFSSQMSFICFE